MQIMKSTIRKRKGCTPVEILLVVGFIALAGIGTYTTYSKVKTSSTASQEAKNLDTLRIGVKSLFAGNQNYKISGNSSLFRIK
jgi:cell division protein FtsB